MLEAQEAAAAASAAAGAGQQPATPPASAGGGSGAVRPLGFCVRMMLVGLAGEGGVGRGDRIANPHPQPQPIMPTLMGGDDDPQLKGC